MVMMMVMMRKNLRIPRQPHSIHPTSPRRSLLVRRCHLSLKRLLQLCRYSDFIKYSHLCIVCEQSSSKRPPRKFFHALTRLEAVIAAPVNKVVPPPPLLIRFYLHIDTITVPHRFCLNLHRRRRLHHRLSPLLVSPFLGNHVGDELTLLRSGGFHRLWIIRMRPHEVEMMRAPRYDDCA